MMKRIFIILALFLFSCVGPDTAFLPQTIKESRENKLLINVYSISDKFVKINDEEFEILEVWTTQKFEKRYSKNINNHFFALRICLKNRKTGNIEPPLDYYDFVKPYDTSTYNGVGINDSMLSLIYKDMKLADKLDFFKIGFIDSQNNEKIVFFKKL